MKFYSLKKINNNFEYDTYTGCIVLAKNVTHARKVAVRNCSDCFANPKEYSCNLISTTGKARLILSDFNAG